MVVLTGVTVELAMRRMQIKPQAQAKLLDELIPAVERIKKDFHAQIGTVEDRGVSIEDGGHTVVIRVDSDNSATITDGDQWHTYRWNETGDPLEYSYNNFTNVNGYERVAENIIYFDASSTHSNTALTVEIGARRYPGQPENISTNPSSYLNTTIFSRMSSAR